MPSFLAILLLLVIVITYSTAFILQDLPLERFERSGHGEEVSYHVNERHTRANQLYRPGANFWARYRMMSG